MRVKCINNKDCFGFVYRGVTVGKDYEVIRIGEDYGMGTNLYTITDDNGFSFTHGISIFRLIKEDKMEEIRVVRKLEDLCNVGNGMGLYIDSNLDVRSKDKKMLICCGSDLVKTNLGVYLEVLKSMGFKFEYKPLRTVKEVLNEARTKIVEFIPGIENYLLVKTSEGNYGVDRDVYLERIDSLYLHEGVAQKYADELNEIIKNK